jgi:hypothetical protein
MVEALTMGLTERQRGSAGAEQAAPEKKKKKWWQFWK